MPRPVSLSSTFADHFSSVAQRYAQYRPHYPQALADALAALCSRRDAAWDAGAGNGQLSVQLAKRFAKVYAQDPSQAQLDAALPFPNVEYRCAKAEESGLPDGSVDLAVAAQAAHWFDWPRYVAEVERIARPGALVALVSYGIMHVGGEADAIVARYYHDDVGAYWPKGREHVENGYRDLVWPWPAVEAPAIDMSVDWTRDELCGYLATWSATAKRIEAKGPAAYEAVCSRLASVWPDGERRTVRWPLAIRLARR
ncbi:MAG TPA: class I SAM-dependent methyltransferase [Kofleriaceae bacterium]|nr:class I SAM-dependent methyltransferase [Kofleriaceae bacterium]